MLTVQGHAAFDADANLQALHADAHSADAGPLRDRYLSGWLALAGLSKVAFSGAAISGSAALAVVSTK